MASQNRYNCPNDPSPDNHKMFSFVVLLGHSPKDGTCYDCPAEGCRTIVTDFRFGTLPEGSGSKIHVKTPALKLDKVIRSFRSIKCLPKVLQENGKAKENHLIYLILGGRRRGPDSIFNWRPSPEN